MGLFALKGHSKANNNWDPEAWATAKKQKARQIDSLAFEVLKAIRAAREEASKSNVDWEGQY